MNNKTCLNPFFKNTDLEETQIELVNVIDNILICQLQESLQAVNILKYILINNNQNMLLFLQTIISEQGFLLLQKHYLTRFNISTARFERYLFLDNEQEYKLLCKAFKIISNNYQRFIQLKQ